MITNKRLFKLLLLSVIFCCMTACGLHPQGEAKLAPPLHRLYIKTNDPYGRLVKYLEQYFAMSKVQVVSSPAIASAILDILKDSNSQVLLSVGASQQTRQYNLITTVEFAVTDPRGQTLIPPYSFTESRTITIQSSEILGTNNEAMLFYQLMHRAIAQAIIRRLASEEVTQALMAHPL